MTLPRRERFADLAISDAEKAAEKGGEGKRIPKLPADKMYRVDPRFSRRPYAKCGRHFLGIQVQCDKGVGKYCYCYIPCTNQYALSAENETGPYVSDKVKELAEREIEDAKKHARDVMRTQRPELETDVEEILRYLRGE